MSYPPCREEGCGKLAQIDGYCCTCHPLAGRIVKGAVMSHAKVGEALGLTHGRVYQIERSALAKMFKRLRARGITSSQGFTHAPGFTLAADGGALDEYEEPID